MPDTEKIVEIFSELRNFADNDVHPVVNPENWHVYSKLCDLIDQAEADALAMLKEQEAEISRVSNEYLVLVGKVSKQPQIVRCKDCKYQIDRGRKYKECDKHFLWTKDDWFCADGERKEKKQT